MLCLDLDPAQSFIRVKTLDWELFGTIYVLSVWLPSLHVSGHVQLLIDQGHFTLLVWKIFCLKNIMVLLFQTFSSNYTFYGYYILRKKTVFLGWVLFDSLNFCFPNNVCISSLFWFICINLILSVLFLTNTYVIFSLTMEHYSFCERTPVSDQSTQP